MLNEKSEEKSLNDLNKLKSGHSKAKHLKHPKMRMRK